MTPPGPERAAHLNLVAFELLLRTQAGNGTALPGEVRWLLDRYALNAPSSAVRLPSVLRSLTPEVRAAVTRLAAEASQQASSAVVRVSPPVGSPGPDVIGVEAAARSLGVETHAVRAAARRNRLHGVKVDGRWAFTTADLDRYASERRRLHGTVS